MDEERPTHVEAMKQDEGVRLSRRAFLGASGSVALGLPTDLDAEDAPPIFFTMPSGSQRVSWASKIWEIDPRWFARAGSLTHDSDTKIRVRGQIAGTNLSIDLSIEIKQISGVWSFVWTVGRQKTSITVAEWFAGGSVSGLTFTKTEALNGAVLVDENLQGNVRWPMRFELSSPRERAFGFSLGARYSGFAKSLTTLPYDAAGKNSIYTSPMLPGEVADLIPLAAVPKVRVSLNDVSLAAPDDGWRVGTIGDGTVLRFLPELPRVIVEAVLRADRSGLGYIWRMTADAERSRLTIGDRDYPRALLLSGGTELVETSNLSAVPYAFIVDLAQAPRMVQGLRFGAMVIGRGALTTLRAFRNTATISLPITLLALHARGEDDARYDIDYRRWSDGDPYLDRSAILAANPWFDQGVAGSGGVEGVLTIGKRPSAKPAEIHLHLGSDSGATVSLQHASAKGISEESPILRARRHQDGMDVGFLFYDFQLDVRNDGSRLVPGKQAQRGVWFHPQHLQEEAFEASDSESEWWLLRCYRSFVAMAKHAGDKSEGEVPKLRKLGSEAEYAEPNVFTKLARTRSAAPSRVIFAPSGLISPTPLSVSALTDWKGLALKVSGRMGNAKGSLDAQIKSVNIKPEDNRQQARDKVNAQFVPPADDETALELVAGLVFSPDETARLRVSGSPDGNSPGLWSAQLELLPADPSKSAASEVRALWAAGLDSANLIRQTIPDKVALAAEPPFKTALDGSQKAEVVIMSSGVAIAALRALSKTGQDVPSSLVRLPEGNWAYLDERELFNPSENTGLKYRQEGVISPVAFTTFEARMTSYGADVEARWKGEPAAPWNKVIDPAKDVPDPFYYKAFDVEEYVHRTSLGSDILVKVLAKGFMFPYGFRVILLSLSQREPQSIEAMGAMAPVIERFFIVPKPVIKSLPGIYQPYNGLEIPVRHARLIFDRSPEIDQDMSLPPELAPIASTLVGKVFWPRFKGLAKEISFDFEADDTGTHRSVPMLFLDNAATHHPPTVRAVMKYYNTLPNSTLTKEHHFGGRTIFAPSQKAGDTSFETDHIILKARSRLVPMDDTVRAAAAPPNPDPDLVQYQMDAFMEGADEAPFYPVMFEAAIKIPPLDRMLGAPQGLKRVGYNSNYIQYGFDEARNASKLYLNFLDAGDVMSFAGNGEIAGALADPSTPLAGITLGNVIVGGKPKSKAFDLMTAKASPQVDPPVGATGRSPFDLSSVENNKFNPAEFFQAPKLLGCIDIGVLARPALMAAQPKLKEVYDYSLGQIGESEGEILKVFSEVCTTAVTAITKALDAAEEKLCAFLSTKDTPVSPSPDYEHLRKFYPELTNGLKDLKTSLEAAAASASVAVAIEHASPIMEDWRRLRGAVDATIANPTPEPVREIVTDLRKALDDAENGLRGVLQQHVRAALEALIKTYVDPITELILDSVFDEAGKVVSAWAYEAFFGPLPELKPEVTREGLKKSIKALIEGELADPPLKDPIPPSVATAPLAPAFTVPLLNLVGTAARLSREAQSTEKKFVGQLAEAIGSALGIILEGIASIQALLDAGASALDRACTIADGPLIKMVNLAEESLPTTTVFRAALTNLDDYLTNLLDIGSSPEADAARQAVAALRVPIGRLAGQLDPLDILKASFASADKLDWCKAAGRIPSFIAQLQRHRKIAADAIRESATQYGVVEDAVKKLADAERTYALGELDKIKTSLVGLAEEFTLAALAQGADLVHSALYARLQNLSAPLVQRVSTAAQQVFDAAGEIQRLKSETPVNLIKVADSVVAIAGIEQDLLALATDYSALAPELVPGLEKGVRALLSALARDLLKPLIETHQFVVDCGQKAIDLVKQAPDIVALLTGPLYLRLQVAHAAVKVDLDDLNKVASDPTRARALINRWAADHPGLAIAARTISEMFDSIARGQIGALFDLAAARRTIEDAVRRLIPSRVTLTYGWNTEFQDVVPVFKVRINEQKAPVAGYEPENDLVLSTRIHIDLLDPKNRSIDIVATLNPFTLLLFGGVDLVRIYFKDTKFTSDGRSSPKFKTDVAAVKTGTALQFIQEIEKSMGIGDGFSILPSIKPPGVQIGYSIGKPVIEMGAVTFLNVALGVTALLPFDSTSALFTFTFASSERPFGIIIKPYYFGGGFVSLTASAEKATFDIQLEFGAAAAIEFGPLSGWGIISAGIALRSGYGPLRLKGFVHALGEGHLGCFGMAVNIEVAVVQEDSTMTGSSSYTYTFSLGLADIDFNFDAEYSIAGGTKHESMALAVSDDDPPPIAVPSDYVLDYKDKTEDWAEYRRHFVEAWA
ncbi:MAG: hypothetical protein KJ670_21845 [Alphaproteobacteria bacterium]|nr:hypothetical protein [Rhizobiaceae bacterium]MBU3962071.1 hypothetical protein [Alphaproteobacteria bacterium]MBU4048140.1 hypothetical protein [Alphaproteobacteria bacterium]MBU4091368.1 hypothetical protein [Alphaproteobacteria bacterium]MBU4159075.1 hypothetical protein [Alphaproteobacteria bacterium]